MKTVFILSISSDIGQYLAAQYHALGFNVIGTYRHHPQARNLLGIKNIHLIKCDLEKPGDIKKLRGVFQSRRLVWDVFISCVGNPLPVQPFFKGDFNEWSDSVGVNCIMQLGVLHALHPFRRKNHADVVFFAGGGMNGAVIDFSAYTASKIFLAKMCEFLDAENKDMNFFIVGPGWTKTKIHHTIIADKRSSKVKVAATKGFLKEGEGTPLADVFESIEWLRGQEKGIVSGRNFSIVHDPWRQDKRGRLVEALKINPDMYKLRRHANDFLQKG